MARFVITTKDGRTALNAVPLSHSRVLIALEEKDGVPEGSVLIPRRRDDDRTQIMHLVHCHGIYEALRGRRHAKATEADDLGEVLLSVEAARGVIQELLAYGVLTDAERRRLREKLATLSVKHESARNVAKAEAADFFDDAIDLEDSRGRKNPTVTMARTTVAARRLFIRLSEIRFIAPRVQMVEAVLIEELARIWWIIDRSLVAPPNSARLPAWFTHAENDVETLATAPFLGFRDRTIADLREARAACRAGRPDDVSHALARIAAGIELKRFQRDLERIIYRMSTLMAQGRFGHDPQKRTLADVYHLRLRVTEFDESAELIKLLTEAWNALRWTDPKTAKRHLKSASHRL